MYRRQAGGGDSESDSDEDSRNDDRIRPFAGPAARGNSSNSTNPPGQALSVVPKPSELIKSLATKVWQSPKGKTALSLWILGLIFMYLAPAPVSITPEMQDKYEAMIREANNLDKFGDISASLKAAQDHVYEAQEWFWRWKSPAREIVAERQKVVDQLQSQVDAVQVKRQELLRQANAYVGIWSGYGLTEARDRFWSSFDSGKAFATRQTFWQMLFSLPNSDNLVATLLEWILMAAMNFTLGLLGSLFYFVFSLGSMIWSFSPNLISGLLFYAIAMLGAVSVVVTYLAGIYGLGAGSAYVVQTIAVRQMQLKYERQQEALRHRRQHDD